jgi:hypothetical protein
MSCERYRNKLVGALAGGESALGGELAAHLRVCVECAKFYEAQVHLFGAIDWGVRAMVNEAVPVSLLPRVRARVADADVLIGVWRIYLKPLAAATAIALLLCVFLVRRENAPARMAVVPSVESPTPKMAESLPTREITASVNGVRRAMPGKPPIVHHPNSVRITEPGERLQVVVGREEAQGLVMLARNISQHPELGQALLQPAAMTEDLVPASQAIKIEDLAVLPLTTQE